MGRSLLAGRDWRLLSQAAPLLPWLCLLLAGVLLGHFAMQWWQRPSSVRWALPPADASYAAGLVAQRHWFGAQPEPALAAAPSVQVLGLWAPLAEPAAGVAVLDDNGQRVTLRAGNALPSGWTLAQVQASGVLLRQAGAERFVPLSRPELPAASIQAVPDPAAYTIDAATK